MESATQARSMECAAAPGEQCDLRSLGAFEDQSGKVGDVEVWQCSRCKIGVTMPPLPDVTFLYEDRESDDFQPTAGGVARRIKELAFRVQARGILDQLPREPDTVLDFGCGSGLFTRCLGDLIDPAKVTGSDFHPEPPAELADRPYLPIDALSAKTGTFDTVLAMHVLEHDDDAMGLLGRIASMVKPGGTVVLETPNIDCVWTDVMGKAWDAWYLPFHRYHFSRESLNGLVERRGLEIISMHDVSVPTMGRSVAKALGRRNTLPFLLAGAALHPVQVFAERVTQRPSALRVIARRTDRFEP